MFVRCFRFNTMKFVAILISSFQYFKFRNGFMASKLPGIRYPKANSNLREATFISATDTIRKKRFVDVRVPVDASPAPPRHMAEPGHHAGHALHRARLERARQARPASEHMAFGPSTPSPNECTIDGLCSLTLRRQDPGKMQCVVGRWGKGGERMRKSFQRRIRWRPLKWLVVACVGIY